MSLSRQLLLRASHNRWLARELPRRAFVRRAVRRFMPGEDVSDAFRAASELAPFGIGVLFTRLGENVTSLSEAAAERDHYLGVLDRIRQAGVGGQISVKLTHLGLDVDRDVCAEHVRALAAHAAETGSFVWIDMEDSHYTDATLHLFRRVRETQQMVGVCLQSYLRRTAADLDRLLPLAPAIRLVKGAYAEPPERAFPEKRRVDENYLTLGTRLLEAAARRNALSVFGTHDAQLIARLRERAGALHVPRDRFEFDQMYGIRAADQRSLTASGASVRVLISYGSDWFPWYMRRLAERPANVWFVLKNLV
ncbi:MAG: proline dehydrogenase family protein [Gemmatimonadaceae bacterium]